MVQVKQKILIFVIVFLALCQCDVNGVKIKPRGQFVQCPKINTLLYSLALVPRKINLETILMPWCSIKSLEITDGNSLWVVCLQYYVHNGVNQNSTVICARHVGLTGIPYIHRGK